MAPLSELGLRILRLLGDRKGIEEMPKLTGATPGAVGVELARLELGGYIRTDGHLTEKGKRSIGK